MRCKCDRWLPHRAPIGAAVFLRISAKSDPVQTEVSLTRTKLQSVDTNRTAADKAAGPVCQCIQPLNARAPCFCTFRICQLEEAALYNLIMRKGHTVGPTRSSCGFVEGPWLPASAIVRHIPAAIKKVLVLLVCEPQVVRKVREGAGEEPGMPPLASPVSRVSRQLLTRFILTLCSTQNRWNPSPALKRYLQANSPLQLLTGTGAEQTSSVAVSSTPLTVEEK